MSISNLLGYAGICILAIIIGMIAGNYFTENILHGLCNEKGIVKFNNTYFLCKQVYSTNTDVIK